MKDEVMKESSAHNANTETHKIVWLKTIWGTRQKRPQNVYTENTLWDLAHTQQFGYNHFGELVGKAHKICILKIFCGTCHLQNRLAQIILWYSTEKSRSPQKRKLKIFCVTLHTHNRKFLWYSTDDGEVHNMCTYMQSMSWYLDPTQWFGRKHFVVLHGEAHKVSTCKTQKKCTCKTFYGTWHPLAPTKQFG